MPTLEEVERRVDAVFARRPAALVEWDDPHPDRQPADGEYSRLTNPGKWRILVARADAWATVLAELGAARADTVAVDELVWTDTPGPIATSAVRLTPTDPGALPLTIARTRLGDAVDAGVVVGVDEPPTRIDLFPDCGCDACDSGSRAELHRIDEVFIAIVSGTFRRLSRRAMTITTGVGEGLSANGVGFGIGRIRRSKIDAVLADPTGWDEISGRPWI